MCRHLRITAERFPFSNFCRTYITVDTFYSNDLGVLCCCVISFILIIYELVISIFKNNSDYNYVKESKRYRK